MNRDSNRNKLLEVMKGRMMKKRIYIILLVIALILGAYHAVWAMPFYFGQFNTQYGTIGTALDTCGVCHIDPAGGGARNPYGTDFASFGHDFAATEALDSDGDTFTNLAEIEARTFPGDPNSRPAAASCVPGDINQDAEVNLGDAITLLRLVSGGPVSVPAGSWESCLDIDSDGKIGLAEVLFTLQSLANMRSGPQAGSLQGNIALSPEIEALTTDSLLIQLEGTDFTAKADADGHFHISGVPAGEYTLLIESNALPSYKYRRTFVVNKGETFDLGSLDLSKTGSISGVATLESSLDNLGIDVYLAGTSFLARTARDGSFRIYYVPEGIYTLVVQHPGYDRAIVEGVAVTAGQDTVLKPIVLRKKPPLTTGSLDGTVYGLDSNGNKTPLAQATVSLFIPRIMMDASHPGPNYLIQTNADGYYSFENLPEGGYIVQATKEGYQVAAREVYVHGEQKATLDFVLSQHIIGLGDLVGFVVEDTGLLDLWKPIAEAGVTISSADGVSHSVLTNPDGGFKFGGLASGTYSLIAVKEAYLEGRASVTIIPDQVNHVTIRLLPDSGTHKVGDMAGIVSDPDGNGLPLARVIATLARASNDKPLYLETVTNDDGGFDFKSIPVGIYQLIVKKEGYNFASLPVEVRTGEISYVTITLEPLWLKFGSITGSIKTSEGTPVPEATIIVEIPVACAQLSMPECIHPVYHTVSDPEGNFKLENLPALEGYLIIGQKGGYEKVTQPSINVVGGETTRVDLIMNPLNSGIKLLLLDENGSPLPNMMAKVSGEETELYQLTDISGTVLFYLKPGDYSLTAPVEKFYRLFGDVVMSQAGSVSDSSFSMPICYPDYLACYDFGLTFIPVSQSVTVTQDQIIELTLVINRFLLKPEAGAQIETPEPVFSWNPFPNAASYTVRVFDNFYTVSVLDTFHTDGYMSTGSAGDLTDTTNTTSIGPVPAGTPIWFASGLTDTTVTYNFDGTGPALIPYRSYSWQITTDSGVSSNRQSFMLVSFLTRYRITGGLIGRDETLVIDKSGLVIYEDGRQNTRLSLVLDESGLQSYQDLFVANHFGELAGSYLPEHPVADGMVYSITLSMDGSVKKVVFGDGGQPPDNLLNIKASLDLLIEEVKTAQRLFTPIDRGSYSGIRDARREVIYTDEDWARLWNEHKGIISPQPSLPAVDFSKEMVIAVFAREMATGGYDITIDRIWQDADGLLHVEYILRVPGPDCIVTQAMTQPFHIVKLALSNSEVIFHQKDVVHYCGK